MLDCIHMRKDAFNEKDALVLSSYGLKAKELSGLYTAHFDPRETVVQQEEPMPCLYIVVHGTAKICINAKNGKNLILCYYVSKGILGDLELVLDHHLGASTVLASTPLTLIAIPLTDNEKYLKGNIAFMNELAKHMASMIRNSDTARVASALYNSEERLCSYILMTQRGMLFTEYLSDTAQSVGMSYRHIFRVMNHLCTLKILKKTSQGYEIINKEALKKKASQ